MKIYLRFMDDMDGFKVSLCWTSICISDASFINFGLGSQGVSRRLPRLALSSAGKIRHLNFSFFRTLSISLVLSLAYPPPLIAECSPKAFSERKDKGPVHKYGRTGLHCV